MLTQVRPRFLRWYYSDSKLARYTRSLYRFIYHLPSSANRYYYYAPRKFYILDDRKLIYIAIPKAGSTSIKSTIGRSYGIHKEEERIHSSSRWNTERGRLPYPVRRYHKFSFVRNPFSRLVSCYIDQVLTLGLRDKTYFKVGPKRIITMETSFGEFVHQVARIPDRWSNAHFRSQYATLYHWGCPLFNWVGRLENIDKDWAALAFRFDLPPKIEHHHSTRERGLYQDYRSFYTQELADLVYKRYRRDFDAFGYTDAYPRLLDYITERDEYMGVCC